MAVGTRMQQRRATAADWATSNYVLAAGELGVTTDTGIIKSGNGTSHWNDLPPAFDSQYLPILGTAANSALLGGVSVDSLVKIADTDVNPTNNTYVKRTADGGVKGTDATEATEFTTLQQQSAAIVTANQKQISRTITANATSALTDIGKIIMVNHASLTAQVTVGIELNATIAFPVGSWFDICAMGVGGAKVVFAGGVTYHGTINIMPDYGTVRMLKIGTNEWIGVETKRGRLPKITAVYTTGGQSLTSTSALAYNTTDATHTYNPDSEWFSIPGTGLATARRIIVNKDGEYLLNLNASNNGLTGIVYASIRKMISDNSATGSTIVGALGSQNVWSFTVQKRLFAGESVGAWITGLASQSLPADASASGGNPNNFSITRIGD